MGALFCLSGDQEGRKILFKGHIAIAAVIAFACLVSLGPGVPGAIGGALGGTAWAAGLLADGDAKALKAGLEAVDDNKPGRARSRGRAIKNPVGAKILLWARLTKPNPKADFAEISAFMAENPDWPGQKNLQRRAEEALSAKIPDDVVLAWFEDREPLSGYGKARLGQALMASGEESRGREIIRDAWINGNFTKRRERSFYKRHRRRLSIDDHNRRLDRLLWEGRYWPVRRMLWKVKPDIRALGIARMFLRQRRGNVDTAIAKVSDELKLDQGLIYERLRWRRRRGKYASAMELLENPPDDLKHPERWWVERGFLARWNLNKGHVSTAYRLANDHRLESGPAFAEAEWLAGWIALQFLGDADVARGHFVRMYGVVKYPVSRARGAYWAARAMQALGQAEEARNWHQLAARHPTTYYGQLSIARLHPGDSLKLPEEPEVNGDETKAFEGHVLVRAVRILGEIGEKDRLRPFISRLDELGETPGWRLLTAELARANGRPDLSVMIAKRAARDGWQFPDKAFPSLLPAAMEIKTGSTPLEMSLVLAVVRQESAFSVKAKSHANAQGLMQLLPRTAYKVAKKLRVPFSRRRLTTDGAYNLTLGRAYLSELLEEFKGSYVLALAAYNAGPRRVRQWIRGNGDIRKADVDSVDWVELIPFRETRNYVQRVLENLQVYRLLLAKTEVALRLERDLHQ
jgi:soluble lytic murein transglycosylase